MPQAANRAGGKAYPQAAIRGREQRCNRRCGEIVAGRFRLPAMEVLTIESVQARVGPKP